MTHRWKSKFSITKIRSTWPCSKFQQNSGHLSFSFSLFKLCLGFRGCPNILFRNEVIHSYPYYLPLWKTGFCWFSKRKTPNFLIQKRIFRVNFLHISDVFFLQADGFLSNGSLIPSHFHAHNCNSARFFLIFQIKRPNFLIQKRIFRVNFLHISDMFSSYKQMVFSAMEARFRRLFIRIIAVLQCFPAFPEKNFKFFDTKTYFKSQFSAYFRSFFFLQADGFLSNWSSIPSHFYANNCNFARFFNFFKQFKDKAPI